MPSSAPRPRGLSTTAFALLTSLCLLLFSGCSFAQHRAGSFTRTLSASGPVSLRVETRSGSISVTSAPGSQVTIQATVYARNLRSDAALVRQIEQNPPIRQVGQQIQIGPLPRTESHRISLSYIITTPAASSADLTSGSGDVQVSSLQGGVNATTGSGNIRAAELGQALHARTGSGDIDARDIHGEAQLGTGSGNVTAHNVGGDARLTTGSGDVTLQGGSGSVRASTGSGSIHLNGVEGDLHASTGSGDVDAQGDLSAQHAWSLNTGSGSIHLNLPANTHAQLDLRADSGSIHTSMPIQVAGKLNPHHLTGTIGGPAPTATLQAHTGSGDIRLR